MIDDLTKSDDIRAVGPLVEALSDTRMRPAATSALIRLLPRLQATDAPLLNTPQREQLCRALLRSAKGHLFGMADTRFALAILQGLQQVGDARELECVAHVAQTARQPSVREAAEACLPFLQNRAEEAAISRQLLRASDSSVTPPDMLLRAAAPAAPTTNPDELLRAGAKEDDEGLEE